MMRLLWIMPLLILGCSTVAQTHDGKYAVTFFSEERSPFGTNGGFVQLRKCDKADPPNLDHPWVNCDNLTPWLLISSQGQGGQVAAGALQATGLGILGAVMPSQGGASASASSASSAVVAPAKGHH